MHTLSAHEIDAIAARNPAAFRIPVWKRFGPLIAIGACTLYTVYCFWFFSIGQVISNGKWGIAGTYLADWVSYEIRPTIEYETGEIVIRYPRFSPYENRDHPEWVRPSTGDVSVRIVEANPAAKDTSGNGAGAGVGGSFMSPSSDATNLGAGAIAPKEDGLAGSFMAPASPATTGNAALVTETVTRTETREGINAVALDFGAATKIDIRPDIVTITHAGEMVELAIDPASETVTATGILPEWARQREQGAKVVAGFGFAGRIEVEADEVKVYHRFFGWENFWFDANSKLWGKPFGEVVSIAFSSERIDLAKSNIALIWDNIVNNGEWQHGDVWIKLLQTIVMAFVGTLFAVLVAFPLSFAAARNITPNRIVNQVLKRFFDFLRSVDMLIWALFFTRAFGPGPLAGMSAIFFTDTGTFGKLYAEALENVDDKQREGVRSVGASPAAVQRYGILPQVLPVFASQALYLWESNTRSATIIGAVGAGGIGLKLWEAMRTNQDWENVAYMVILILVVVFVFDNISNALRSRLIGKTQH